MLHRDEGCGAGYGGEVTRSRRGHTEISPACVFEGPFRQWIVPVGPQSLQCEECDGHFRSSVLNRDGLRLTAKRKKHVRDVADAICTGSDNEGASDCGALFHFKRNIHHDGLALHRQHHRLPRLKARQHLAKFIRARNRLAVGGTDDVAYVKVRKRGRLAP